MQYILDQNEYDEYIELKGKDAGPDKPDELMHLLVSGKAQFDVRELMHGYKEQYEVMIKVDLEDLSDAAKDLVMSRIRRY